MINTWYITAVNVPTAVASYILPCVILHIYTPCMLPVVSCLCQYCHDEYNALCCIMHSMFDTSVACVHGTSRLVYTKYEYCTSIIRVFHWSILYGIYVTNTCHVLNNQKRDLRLGIFVVSYLMMNFCSPSPVSYTHLTLPTKA